MAFKLGFWYTLTTSNGVTLIFKFGGEADSGLIFKDCKGNRIASFPLFKKIEEIGKDSPC